MKKWLIVFFGILSSFLAIAQERTSDAYDSSISMGKIVGIVAIAGFVIWGVARYFRKK
jgi:hypothetical protein